jgi:hypothetical protein
MPGPVPKPPGLRQRRNKVSTRSVLPSVEESKKRKVPPLPSRESKTEKWHPRVLDWWKKLWKSPMAAEFLDVEIVSGLHLIAELQQRRWTVTDLKELIAIAGELRQQEIRFGVSPLDRRRLQWEIEKAEQADERTKRRRQVRDDDKKRAGKDPRDILKVSQGGKR